MWKAKDLTGQRFGRLVALRDTGNRQSGAVIWECRCDCGNVKLVSSVHLTFGETQSCGCLVKDKTAINGRANRKDLTGQKFGRLTALCPTEERRGKCVVWECKCDCGNTFLARTDYLRNGGVRSCGCLKIEKTNKPV